MFLYI
jgi:hypothetical protein